MLKMLYVLFTKCFMFPLMPLCTQWERSSRKTWKFEDFLLFQSKAFHFVYRKKKVYPVEMKSLRVERKLQWCLVQKKTEIRGNKANFKPLTLGLPVPSSFSADTSVASISALMISRALRIQLCCRLICLCSSFHWLAIICSMSFSPSPKWRGKKVSCKLNYIFKYYSLIKELAGYLNKQNRKFCVFS